MNSQIQKTLRLVIGYIAVALGIIGAFVPLMPTTCFLILAVWAFSTSAPHRAKQILEHPRFGPAISEWVNYKTISRKTKNVITASILLTFSVTLFFYRDSIYVSVMLVSIMLVLLAYINTRRETVDETETRAGLYTKYQA